MVDFPWIAGSLLFAFFVLVAVSIIFTRRRGYFLSIHSLRVRTFFGRIKQTPFRLFVNMLSRARPGELLVTRFQGVARALMFGFGALVLAVACVVLFPSMAAEVVSNNLTAHVDTAWQVHATITGFSVVALVFVWETLEANVQASKLVGEMTEAQGLLDRIYFLVIANLFIGAGLFMSSPLSSESAVTETPVLFQRLGLVSVVLVSVFLVVSAWVLLKYYEDIHTLLFRKGPDQIAVDLYQQQLEDEGELNSVPTYREIIESRLGTELSPYMTILPKLGQSDVIRVSTEELDLGGEEITDIDLSGLSTVVEMVGEDADVSFWYNLGERPRDSTSIMRADAEISDSEREILVDLLRESYNFKS